ncbi:hypothetical protein QJQ45_022687, partial [Haematococcus lacustris]
MLIINFNFGGPALHRGMAAGVGVQWQLSPLMMIASIFLCSGGLHSLLESIALLTSWACRLFQPNVPSNAEPPPTHESLNILALCLFCAAVMYGTYRGSRWAYAQGGWLGVLRMMVLGAWGIPNITGAGGLGGAATMPGTQAPHQARAAPEAVLLALRKLATEEYAGPAELEQMSVHALKGRLAARGIDCSKAVEKRELLTLLEADGGSSATSCSVCCEDYVAGDAVRVLGCRHKYRECGVHRPLAADGYRLFTATGLPHVQPPAAVQYHLGP